MKNKSKMTKTEKEKNEFARTHINPQTRECFRSFDEYEDFHRRNYERTTKEYDPTKWRFIKQHLEEID